MTEAAWLACKNPLVMPKVLRGRPPHRKCCLLAGAYALDSPGGFRAGVPRAIVATVQRVAALSPARGDFMPEVRAALRRDFARFLDDHALGLGAGARGLKELGADDGELDIFLWSVVRHGPPGRGSVNQVAGRLLSRVRQDARREVRGVLQAVRLEHPWQNEPRTEPLPERPARTGWRGALDRLFPPTSWVPPWVSLPTSAPDDSPPEGFKQALLALLPDVERAGFRDAGWYRDTIPPRIVGRLGTLAADARAAAAGEAMAELARDILGNPFRPVVIDPAWREWNHGVVRQIGEQILRTGGFADLPILADALEDAGCSDAAILDHCRSGGPHVPGCWALDAVLGR